MKKLSILLSLVLVSFLSFSQKIKVEGVEEKVNDVPRKGLGVEIDLEEKLVKKLWEKKLKEFGKVESSKGAYYVNGGNMSKVSSSPVNIISSIKSSKSGQVVWYAIDLGDSYVTTDNKKGSYRDAEQILKDFAIQCYTEDINNQIEDAQKALEKTEKEREKKVKEGDNLVKDVENNKKEKEKLEQKLKENADDLVKLQAKQEQNKKDQASANQEVEKMKQAVEAVKAKLNKIDR
jgi:hypothetical protein